jgi:hypothetical protein
MLPLIGSGYPGVPKILIFFSSAGRTVFFPALYFYSLSIIAVPCPQRTQNIDNYFKWIIIETENRNTGGEAENQNPVSW